MTTNQTAQTRDMGIYLHIPFCKQKCIYCDFPAYQGLTAYYDDYVEALIKEIDLWCAQQPESTTCPVDTIYFGGGTPTELSNSHIELIMERLAHHFTFKPNVQISIEANPGETTHAQLSGLHNMGFNRISFGVQTFDDEALRFLHRSHTSREAIEQITEAYDIGFTDINLDLIYALPNQTIEDIERNLAIVNTLPINHISSYGLQVEEGTYLEHLVRRESLSLPDEDIEDDMYDAMMDGIEALGFERYEISNFAKHEAYSRHNLRYWQYKDYLGFGAGAHSFYNGIRRGNNRYVVPYLQMLGRDVLPAMERDPISTERAQEDYCFLALRTKGGINEQHFFDAFGVHLMDEFGTIIDSLVKDNLLISDNGSYRLNSVGTKHGNYVFSQFLR